MILQEDGTGVIAIRQIDHARLAGDIAAEWGGPRGFRPEPWGPLQVATYTHDDGWAEWDESPPLDDRGGPYDFLSMPTLDRVEIYRKGIDLASGLDLHARILISMHLTGLFRGRYEPGASAAINSLSGEELDVVNDFVEEEEGWQASARRKIDDTNLWAQYRLLQTFDRLSLTLCRYPISSVGSYYFDRVPRSPEEEDASLQLSVRAGHYSLSPYPLTKPATTFTVEGRRIGGGPFGSKAKLREELRSAAPETITFVIAGA